MKILDTVLISFISIMLFVVVDKLNQKRKAKKVTNNEAERYFNLKCEDAKYEASCTVKGGDTLLGVMEEFRKNFGFGIEFNITEITKEEFDSIKETSKE